MTTQQTATAYQAHRAMLRTVRAHAVITSAARTTTRTTAAQLILKARTAARYALDCAQLAAYEARQHDNAPPCDAQANTARQSAHDAHADAITARDAMRDMTRAAQILYPKPH